MTKLKSWIDRRDEAADDRFDRTDMGDGGASHYGYIEGADWARAETLREVEEWKAKYIEARASGYAEGKEEANPLLEALEVYAALEALADLGTSPTIGAGSKVATKALAKFKGEGFE